MTLPPLSILIPTYARYETLIEAIIRLNRFLAYPGKVTIYVGDDTPQDQQALTCYGVGDIPIIVISQPSGSLGANLNRLLRATPDNLLMQMDDDHLLTGPLDLEPHARRLLEDESAGWVRLWLPECTCDGSHYYKFSAQMKGGYWRVEPYSELYGPSNRPHIKHRRFHKHYGPYSEGLKLGATEEEFCHRWQDKASKEPGPDVLIPVHLGDPRTWLHGADVGVKSWQSEGK